jgi:hypothetical protein
MGIWAKLTGELVPVVEWVDDTLDTIVWRFPRYYKEIKSGAQLIVREASTSSRSDIWYRDVKLRAPGLAGLAGLKRESQHRNMQGSTFFRPRH